MRMTMLLTLKQMKSRESLVVPLGFSSQMLLATELTIMKRSIQWDPFFTGHVACGGFNHRSTSAGTDLNRNFYGFYPDSDLFHVRNSPFISFGGRFACLILGMYTNG